MTIFCSGLKGRRLRGGGGGGGGGGFLDCCCLGFLFWRRGGVGVEGDGCNRWSVAGGDDGVLLIDARKTVPTVAVRDQAEQIEKIIFYFICIFCFLFLFFNSFFVFFMFTVFEIPDIERRKKQGEPSHRPATRTFVRN